MPNKHLPLFHPMGYKMNPLHAVVETEVYLSRAVKLLTEAEREGIVNMVAMNPQAGVVIPGMGGLRKMRIGVDGRGKRGGGRVIYWFQSEWLPAVLMFVFAKNEASDLTPVQARTLVKYAAGLAEDFGGRGEEGAF
jgi:RelE toxin of RelE / RelB toxin-antitoxin system